MKVSYDKKPESLRVIGDGRCVYCWNIVEHKQETSEMPDIKDIPMTWDCEQVVVYEPLSQDKILSAVISEKWDNNYEQKLLNECMSAQMGIYESPNSEVAKKKIANYQKFLQERNAIKNMVDKDCAREGIK